MILTFRGARSDEDGVLVVEDEAGDRLARRVLISRDGHEVIASQRRTRHWPRLAAEPVDLVAPPISRSAQRRAGSTVLVRRARAGPRTGRNDPPRTARSASRGER